MKNWRNRIILLLGLLLVLGAFVVYVVRVAQTIPPAGLDTTSMEQWTVQHGLDRPLAEQYLLFLLLFLPGMTILGLYGTIGARKVDFQRPLLTKVVLVLAMCSNTFVVVNYAISAPHFVGALSLAYWMTMVLVLLALLNFLFALLIWNGYKSGMWGFGIASVIFFFLGLVGGMDFLSLIFSITTVAVLYFLLHYVRPDITEQTH